MLTPVATVIFAVAMALSLSVEADSFFHPSVDSDADTAEGKANSDGEASGGIAIDGSAAEP